MASNIRPHSPSAEESTDAVHNFTPTGAITFFALLMVLFALLWFSLYFELINRV